MWMWVPRRRDLTMMGTNGCLSKARRYYPDCLIRSDPLQKLPEVLGPRPSQPSSDEYRRSSLSFCVVDSEHVNGITHVSQCVMCISFPIIQRGKKNKKQVVFQCNLFIFLRAVWYDTCSCLLVLGLCFIVLIFQIKLLSVIHTDPGFNVACPSDLCPLVDGDAGMWCYLRLMLLMLTLRL